MKFLNDNSRLKNLLLLLSFGILILILWNTYLLFQTFKQEERLKMEIWASAYKKINEADQNTDLELPMDILSKNYTIPIILVNTEGKIEQISNVPEEISKNSNLQKKYLQSLKSQNTPLVINHPNGEIKIYYGNSSLITKLKYYPLALIVILILFGALVFSYFRTSKISAENKLWAGMAKETAHQIGTPLSSLLGWMELLKLEQQNQQIAKEIEKDVLRLETIANRFSKIGSAPVLTTLDIVNLTAESFDYIKSRSSKQIEFQFQSELESCILPLNETLHSWTIENLVKNAIDAIKGKGEISIKITQEDKNVCIYISDTGKGIEKSKFKTIFEPGFSTKKRGWGLGLSLVKRIVEDFHKGKVKVLRSEIGKGTTFLVTFPMDYKK